MLLVFWIPVPLATVILCCLQVDRQPCTKSRRKKGNKSTWILRRCRDRLTAYWAPHTPMHEKTPKEGNGQPPKGVGVKKTINVCPRGAGAVHELHPCIARYPLQQFYFNGEPIATFTRAMLLGVVLNLSASFISLKYWLLVSLIWIVFMASICHWYAETQKLLFSWLRPWFELPFSSRFWTLTNGSSDSLFFSCQSCFLCSWILWWFEVECCQNGNNYPTSRVGFSLFGVFQNVYPIWFKMSSTAKCFE